MWTALLGWTAYVSINYPRWNTARRGKISSFNAVKWRKWFFLLAEKVIWSVDSRGRGVELDCWEISPTTSEGILYIQAAPYRLSNYPECVVG